MNIRAPQKQQRDLYDRHRHNPPTGWWWWFRRPPNQRFLAAVLVMIMVVIICILFWNTMSRPSSFSFSSFSSASSSTSSSSGNNNINLDNVLSVVYESVPEDDNNPSVLRYAAYALRDKDSKQQQQQKRPLTVYEWAQLLARDDDDHHHHHMMAQETLTTLLQKAPFVGMRFETKGVTKGNAKQKAMEFVLVKDESLARFAKTSNSKAFNENLNDTSCNKNNIGCAFENLSGDAMLVVPKPVSLQDVNVYGHLAAFLRGASPQEQIYPFWRLVAKSYLERLNAREDDNHPLWLSTAGKGVAWLHFRLDDHPKYYHYRPFAMEK